MKEELIKFETAKLAKKKKFIEYCHSYYFEDGEFKEHELTGSNGYYGEDYCHSFDEFLENWNSIWFTTKNGDRCFGCSKDAGYFETFSAPSQTILQKWLREVHRISICVDFRHSETNKIEGINSVYYDVNIYTLSQGDAFKTIKLSEIRDNYEEALEVGLYEALKLIQC